MEYHFNNAFDAGYDAGKNGANTFNSHYRWFATKESMQEWQRGNDAGSKKREADREAERKLKLKSK